MQAVPSEFGEKYPALHMQAPALTLQLAFEPQPAFDVHLAIQFFPLPVGDMSPGRQEQENTGFATEILPVHSEFVPH